MVGAVHRAGSDGGKLPAIRAHGAAELRGALDELARRIDQEIQKALADPAFRDKVQADGTEIVGLGHQAFPEYLRQDLQKWKRAVELSGAKVD